MQTAADLMQHPLYTVPHDAPLATCARLFLEHDLRHLPVLDADGGLVGVVTEEAVYRWGALTGDPRVWMPFEDAEPLAGTVAETAEVTLAPDTPLTQVVRDVANCEQDFGIVCEQGSPVGILTEHDFVWLAQWALPETLAATTIASSPVVSVASASSSASAWDEMRRHGVRHLVVLDGETVKGILSIRDLIAEDVQRGEVITAGDLCRSEPLHTVTDGQEVCEAAGLMVSHKVGCLPVVDDGGRPVAVLTRTDVLRAMVGRVTTPIAVGSSRD